MSGKWMIDVQACAGKVRLQLQSQQKKNERASFHLSVKLLQGLSVTEAHAGVSRANFQLMRDAGTFYFTGFFRDGRGSGDWTFKGNSALAAGLREHGYEQLTEDDLYRLALSDISAAYISQLARAGYGKLTASKLIALESNRVTEGYIRSLQDAGYRQLTTSQLLALRTNGVTTDFIKRLQSRGHKNLTVERILSIRTNRKTSKQQSEEL